MTRRHKRGRPPRLLGDLLERPEGPRGPTLVELMLGFIRAGVRPPVAAQAIGISRATYYRWMTDGAKSRAPAHLRRFHDEVLRAKAIWISNVSRAVTENIHKDPALGLAILRAADPDGRW